MWWSKPDRREVVDPATGLGTGEWSDDWTDPAELRVNAAPPTGDAEGAPFGTEVAYDLVLVADGNPDGIAEGDALWLRDSAPAQVAPGLPDMDDAYTVVRVSPSLNFCAFGLTRRQGR